MINYGLAQISRAYGQSAKSQTRAVAVLLALARVKNCYNPHPLWLGFVVAWINCGLDSLWLGSNLTSLRPEGQVANAPRACNNLLQPSPLWLGFIVPWTGQLNKFWSILLFNLQFGKYSSLGRMKADQ